MKNPIILSISLAFVSFFFNSCEKNDSDTVYDPIWTENQVYTNKAYGNDHILTPEGTKMMVKFSENFDSDGVDYFAIKNGLFLIKQFKYDSFFYAAFSISSGSTLEKTGTQIQNDGMVEGALPVYIDQYDYERMIYPGQFTVQFIDSISENDCTELISSWGVEIYEDYYRFGAYTLSLPEGMNVFEAIREYMKSEKVKYTAHTEYSEIIYHTDD